MSKQKNKARGRQLMIISGVFLLIFGLVLLGLKFSEQQPKAPQVQTPVRGQSLKSPGAAGTDGVVGQAVNNSKFAALEDLIKQQAADAKKREDEIRRELENKAREDSERRERESGNKGVTTTAGAGTSSSSSESYKIFDPGKLGRDVKPSAAGPMGEASAGRNSQPEAKASVELMILEFGQASGGAAPAAPSAGAPRTVVPQAIYPGLVRPSSADAITQPIGTSTRSIHGAEPSQSARRAETYLPSGTTFKVSVLTGMDAPTGGQAQNNPHPMLLHVTSLGQLPNQFKADIKHCAITAQGYGDLPAERGYIRTENLACVRNNGEVIDVPIMGHVIGGDGKVGLRGRVVTKQGQVLSNALWTSMISSFGDMAKLASTNVTIVPSGSSISAQNNNLSNAELLKRGALGGLGETAKQLSQYYINLAEKLYPVVEIDGGQTADVVLTQGVSLLNQTPRGQMSDIYGVGQQLRDLISPALQRK